MRSAFLNRRSSAPAIAKLDHAIELDPGYADAWLLRGAAYAYLGEYASALRDLDEAFRLVSSSRVLGSDARIIRKLRVPIHLRNAQYEKAAADLSGLIGVDNRFLFERSDCYMKMGNYQLAVDDITSVILSRSRDGGWVGPDLWCRKGDACIIKGDLDEATASYEQAIQAVVARPEWSSQEEKENLYAKLAELKKRREHDKAIADRIAACDAAIRLDPNDADAYSNRGLAYDKKGDHDKALADYTEAIRVDRKCVDAYFNRGLAYGYKGEHESAIADYTEAIRLDPNDALAYNNRGFTYVNIGDHDKAFADYDKAIQLDPQLALAYTNRGLAYAGNGQFDKAIADFTKAIQLDPNDAEAYFSRGEAYESKGERAEAEADFAKAAELGWWPE